MFFFILEYQNPLLALGRSLSVSKGHKPTISNHSNIEYNNVKTVAKVDYPLQKWDHFNHSHHTQGSLQQGVERVEGVHNSGHCRVPARQQVTRLLPTARTIYLVAKASCIEG